MGGEECLLFNTRFFLKERHVTHTCQTLNVYGFVLTCSGSVDDQFYCIKSVCDRILGLYYLQTSFWIEAEKHPPLPLCLLPLRFLFSSSSMGVASSSDRIMHLLVQDITLGSDDKHLISEKLMNIGSLLTFLLSHVSILRCFHFSNLKTTWVQREKASGDIPGWTARHMRRQRKQQQELYWEGR